MVKLMDISESIFCEEYPKPEEYGKTIIRVFYGTFDAVLLENSSGTGNYCTQLMIGSDCLKYRRKQGALTNYKFTDWVTITT